MFGNAYLTPEEFKELALGFDLSAAGLNINENVSHLNNIEQNFDFEIPDEDWRYYLIAIATRPE